ncbi:MAG TPA: type II toxin-antitoxin system prevent-host-death family antitoxin [Thermomicrobiales bacterium]|nr:type II toxin-antitoxin system prevent-host-death family antitoxin [Thermomicrobiales bacterium]
MREHQTMKSAEASQQFDGLIRRVSRNGTRIVVEDRGVPVAAIISADDLARLDRLEAEREADFRVIDDLRDASKEVSDEEIERETDRVLATALSEEASTIR